MKVLNILKIFLMLSGCDSWRCTWRDSYMMILKFCACTKKLPPRGEDTKSQKRHDFDNWVYWLQYSFTLSLIPPFCRMSCHFILLVNVFYVTTEGGDPSTLSVKACFLPPPAGLRPSLGRLSLSDLAATGRIQDDLY